MSNQNVKLTVLQGGITHAILNKLQNDGVIKEGENLSSTIWSKIMDEVKKDANDQYTGGSNFVLGQNADARASWRKNFKIKSGQILDFSVVLWNKIVTLAKGETISGANQNLSPVIIDPEPQQDKDKSVVDDDNSQNSTIQQGDGKEKLAELRPIPDGAKQMLRNIVNVDSNTKGNKETIVMTENDDGVKVYNQAITDSNTGSVALGSRLIEDKKFGFNEFYTVDDTIPDGAEVDKKTVNGNEETLTYEIEEEGETHRYLMTKNDENGKYQKGDEIFAIKNSTLHCNTNKFVSETELNNKLRELNINKSVQELSSFGIEVQQYNNGTIAFKKDGKTFNATDLNAVLKPSVYNPNGEIKITDEIKDRIKSIRTNAVLSNFTYEFTESELKTSGSVSLMLDYQNQEKESIGLMAKKLPMYKNTTSGLYTKFGCESFDIGSLDRRVTFKIQKLIMNQAIYNDLLAKQESELTDMQKKFMKKHEQEMARLFQEYDARYPAS